MPNHWLLIGICFYGINFINCVEDAADSIRRGHKPIWNETYADALKRDLLTSYDKFLRPTQHNKITTVTLELTIIHVDFDEMDLIFTVHGWFRMAWDDDKLKWNESNYGGASSIILAPHEIWQPDIKLFNSISPNFDYYGSANSLVRSSGSIVWIPPVHFKTLCDADFRYWPFDSHTCILNLGTWVHHDDEIDLNAEGGFMFQSHINNPEWKINNMTVGRKVTMYPCCPEPYVSVQYNITIERRSSIYRTVILTPAFVVILLTLLTFWLPAQYGEKILLNGVTALIIVLFLLYFSQKISVMALHTPLVVLFYSHSLYLVCFSTFIAVVVINLTRVKHYKALPYFIKKHLDGKLGKFLLLNHVNDCETRAPELPEDLPNDELQITECRSGK